MTGKSQKNLEKFASLSVGSAFSRWLLQLAVIKQLKPGKGVLHMEFEPRGEEVWLSVRDEDRVEVYDTESFERKASMPAKKPSGIFFSARAHRIGL